MDAKKFAHAVEDGVRRATQHAQHQAQAGITPQAALTDFCSIWPSVKPVLGVVSGFLTWIPGYGAVAQGALHGLVNIGDEVAGELCSAPAPTGAPAGGGPARGA